MPVEQGRSPLLKHDVLPNSVSFSILPFGFVCSTMLDRDPLNWSMIVIRSLTPLFKVSICRAGSQLFKRVSKLYIAVSKCILIIEIEELIMDWGLPSSRGSASDALADGKDVEARIRAPTLCYFHYPRLE